MRLLVIALILCPALLLARNPVEDIAIDRVDLIELNHCYDEHGCLVFEQIIFYEWSPHTSHYNVKDWRSLKVISQLPVTSVWAVKTTNANTARVKTIANRFRM